MKFAPLKRLTILSLASAGVMIVGCDDLSASDKAVQEKLNASEAAWNKVDTLQLRQEVDGAKTAQDAINSAAADKSADPVWRATSAGAAGDLGTMLAITRRAQLTEIEHRIRAELSNLRVMTQQVALTNLLAKGYALTDPKAEVVKIEAQIKDMQGDANKAIWSPDGGKAQIPTLTSIKQQISKLTGDIASRKEQIATLTKDRQAALALAEQKFADADKAKGNEAVSIFTEGADARKKSELVVIQIDLEQDQLARLEADLALAQGQEKAIAAGVALLQEQVVVINAGWTDTQTRMQNQRAIAESILAGGEAVHASISASATDLAKLMVLAKDQRTALNNELEQAAKYYKDAASAGSAVATDKRVTLPPPGNKAFKDLKESVHTNRYNLPLAGVMRIQGTVASDEAILGAEIERVRSALRTELDAAGKSVPTDMPTYEVSEIRSLVTSAEEKLKDSNTMLVNVAEGDSPKYVANASLQSRLVTLHRLIELQELKQALNITTDAGSAAELKSDAIAAKANVLAAGVRLPAIPGELGQAPAPTYVPPPTSPVAPPATGGGEAEPAPAPTGGGIFGQPAAPAPETPAPAADAPVEGN